MKVIVYGAGGRMGREVINKISGGFQNAEIAALVDSANPSDGIIKDINSFVGYADAIVDFSYHTLTEEVLNYAVKRHMPAVICTTGHTEEEKKAIFEAAKRTPIFYSGNMSVGVALLCSCAKTVAAGMADADIEIVETHHRYKKDAPSGTALMLAEAVKSVRPDSRITTGRSGMSPREKDEIGIQSVRMGNIVGIHEVHICSDSQEIVLRHEAFSRALFAEGALTAAAFISDKADGLYNMGDMVK